jgi:hypothetical protein
VETLSCLGKYPDLTAVLIDRNSKGVPRPPRFYTGKNIPHYVVAKGSTFSEEQKGLAASNAIPPNYLILLESRRLDERLAEFRQAFGCVPVFVRKIDPTPVDWLLHAMNPRHNVNQTSFIYRITDCMPSPPTVQ